MSARWIAVALIAGRAIALYAAVAVPLQRQAAAAAEDYRRARDERRDMRSRAWRAWSGATPPMRRAAPALAGRQRRASTVRGRVRRSVVQTLQSARVSGVRLGVRPGAPALRRARAA